MIATVADPPDPAAARATLRWLVDAGADVLVVDTPRSWLERAVPALAPPPRSREADAPAERPAPRAPATRPPATGNAGIAALADTLARTGTMIEVAAAARAHAGPHALLFDGAPASGVLFVTDTPTDEDARAGRLFAGAPGQLLDRMLAAIGLDRARVCLAACALVPGGEPDQIAFLHRLVALERPRVLVALGGPATVRLTHETRGLNRLRGQWKETSIGTAMVPILPTFSPAHLLANPAHKALAWADLLTLRARLDASDANGR